MALRILVPPGIGDIYWVLVKLRGFLEEKGFSNPEIWIDAPNDKKRALQFVERIPFVTPGGYFDREKGALTGPMHRWKQRKGWEDLIRWEAYQSDGRHAFPDVDGFDWFMSYNGSMDKGKSLDEMDPQWPADWDIDFKITPYELEYGRALKSKIGPYVIAAVFDAGFYKHWFQEMSVEDISGIFSQIRKETGFRIVLTGASWDHSPVNLKLLEMDKEILSLIGETTLEEYFSALRASEGCIGFPAGNTMMGAAFGIPTVIIWNKVFPKKFHSNACPPKSLGNWYEPVDTIDSNRKVIDTFVNLMRKA